MTFALKGVGGWVVEKCMDVREATVKGGYVKMPTGGPEGGGEVAKS